jgi:flagellar biosynthesis/type III secretory pathway M-ring protein FliF/YscJ
MLVKVVDPLFHRIFKKYDALNNSVQENVSGIRVVKAFSRENYENIIRERIEESVEEILSKPYGRDNVSAACTVSINYDKINEEMLEYLTNENNEGVVDWKHIIYKGEGLEQLPAEGPSGEEDNTDIPSYPNESEEYTITDPDYLEKEITYSIGHVLTQTEKAQGVITDSTIAITIKTPLPLSNVEKSGVIDLVKNATAISDTTKISVFDWQSDELEEDITDGMLSKDKVKDYKILLLILALIAITLIAIIIIILVRRDAKKKIQANEKKNKKAVDQLEAKLAETKRRSLVEMANETNREQKETKDEVRQFALDNPDLTAAIVRSMIKEDEYGPQEQEDGE